MIKKFGEFVNESKYENTWYDNITKAKQADDNYAKFVKGLKIVTKFKGQSYERDPRIESWVDNYAKKYNTSIPNQHKLVRDMGYDEIAKQSDKNIIEFLKNKKDQIKNEAANSKLYSLIRNELVRIHKNDGIHIIAHGGIYHDDKLSFLGGMFKTNKDTLEFLKNSEEIFCYASPEVVDKFKVEYSGTIKNDKGDSFEFNNVYNGFAINPS